MNTHFNRYSDGVNFHEARVNFSLMEDQTEIVVSSSLTHLSKNERRRGKKRKTLLVDQTQPAFSFSSSRDAIFVSLREVFAEQRL